MFGCYTCGDRALEMIGNWDEFADKYDDDQWEECEADFEAKACDESRPGTRGCRVDFFTSGWCIRSGRSGQRCAADAELFAESCDHPR